MDEGARSKADECVVGPTTMADAVAVVHPPRGEEADEGAVRAAEEAAPRSLPRPQGRFDLRFAGSSLLHGSL